MFNNATDLFKKLIISDESWVYSYDMETKAQSSYKDYKVALDSPIRDCVFVAMS